MIHARNLTRHFRVRRGESVPAVRGLDLDIEAGELVAFLGPNGAGKSTSLRMLTTLLPPTSGTATVAGYDIRTDPAGVRRRIGYIGQGNGAGHYFRVRDELITQGRCYGLDRATAHRRADEVLAELDLTPLARRTAAALSGGQRRRLDVAIGLVHRPTVLFLDEPSTGLDPQNRANLAEHIRRLRAEHAMTVFLTTHYLDEADALAERVLVIDQGRVIADDTPERLKAGLGGDLLTVALDTSAEVARAADLAARIPRVQDVAVGPGVVRLRAGRADALLPEYLRALDAEGLTARAADVRRPTLDDVFLALTGRRLREDA